MGYVAFRWSAQMDRLGCRCVRDPFDAACLAHLRFNSTAGNMSVPLSQGVAFLSGTLDFPKRDATCHFSGRFT